MNAGRLVRRMRPILNAALLTLAVGGIWATPVAAADLPDLVVTSAKVTMQCNADGTRIATIFVIVKNQGKGVADLSKSPWHVILKADWWRTQAGPKNRTVTPQTNGPPTLKPGGWIARTLTITGIQGPPAPKGDVVSEGYGFKVVVDPAKIVTESDESNNEKLVYVDLDKNCQPFP